MIFGIPIDAFIGIMLLMSTFLIVGYLLLREALVSAHFEIKRREQEQERLRQEQMKRGGRK